WNRVINDAMANLWTLDRISLGTGAETGARSRGVFSLNAHLPDAGAATIYQVDVVRYDSNGIAISTWNANMNGAFWEVVPNGPNELELHVYPEPSHVEHVEV